MIRKLLATTAVATLISTGAIAQTTTPAPMDPAATTTQSQMVVRADGHLASNIIGKNVYNGAGDDAQNIGSVNDLVIGPDGEVRAIVVGVGGFLGLGQKNVALEYDIVEWAERDGDRWLIVATTQEALEAQPEFDTSAYQPMPADADVAETAPATREDLAIAPAGDAATGAAPAEPLTDDTAAAPAAPVTDDTAAAPAAPATNDTAAAPAQPMTNDMAAAPVDDTATTAAIDRNSLQPAGQMRAEDFIGTTVYGANEENVGSIGDIVLNAEGEVDAVIIDVGGFLGIGTKEVAVGMDNLAFMTDSDGNRYLYTEFTQEQLEAAPEYDDASYATHRDDQRVVMPN